MSVSGVRPSGLFLGNFRLTQAAGLVETGAGVQLTGVIRGVQFPDRPITTLAKARNGYRAIGQTPFSRINQPPRSCCSPGVHKCLPEPSALLLIVDVTESNVKETALIFAFAFDSVAFARAENLALHIFKLPHSDSLRQWVPARTDTETLILGDYLVAGEV